MADPNIKKTRVLKSALPPIDYDNLKYNARYRVISEDRNRTSHWSPIYNSDGSNIIGTTGALSISEEIITAVWGDENLNPEYDVFVSFNGNPFFWHGTSAVHSYSFLNEGTTTVHVKIQLASSKKEIKAGLVIFDSGSQPLI